MPDWKDRPGDMMNAGQPGFDSRGRALKGGTIPITDQIDMNKNGMANSKRALQRRITEEEKLTPKQEKFAQLMATLEHTQKDAAIEAGFSETHAASTACRLMKEPKVKRRIDEIMLAAQKRNEVTMDEVIEGLRRNAEAGFASGQIGASNAALIALGRFAGIGAEPANPPQVNVNVDLTSGDDEADAARLARIARLVGTRKTRETE